MKWEECSCCKRRFQPDSLELGFCEECYSLLIGKFYDSEDVVVDQRLRYLDFKDAELAEVVRIIWRLLEKRLP